MQLVKEINLATQCFSTLGNIIFHGGVGREILQHHTELTNIFQSNWTGFYTSTLKKKSYSGSLKEPSERGTTKPARKIRFSVYLTDINLINFNSEAVTRLRPTWEMKVGKRFHGKGSREKSGFLIRKPEEMQGGL